MRNRDEEKGRQRQGVRGSRRQTQGAFKAPRVRDKKRSRNVNQRERLTVCMSHDRRQRDTDIVEPVMMCDLENIDSHLTLQLIWGNSTEPQPGNAYYPQCYTITYARQKWMNPNILSKGWAIPMTCRYISVNFSQKTKSNKKFEFCVKPKVNVTKRNKNIGMLKHRAAYM